MATLRSLLFATAFYLGSFVIVTSGVAMVVFDARAVRSTTRRWARYHRWCAASFLGVRGRIEGRLPAGPALVAAKHQSMYETIDMLLLLREPIVVMKKELVDIPGWGWLARRYGVIAIDRAGGAGALRQMLAAAREAVASGRPIAIFPEGTRVMPGETPPLQPGFAGLYRTLGLPVVPLATDSGRIWPRGFVKRPGTIRFRFGDPIPPGLKRQEIEARVHAAINILEETPADWSTA